MPMGKIISCFKACKMIDKGFLYHVVRFKDQKCETSSIETVPIVREFPDVFPNDLPGVPLQREINIGIDLLMDMNPIKISPYRMAPTKLKELKLRVKDFLDKGFIQPTISPRGSPVLFVKNKDGSFRMN